MLVDSLKIDSLEQHRRYILPRESGINSVSAQNNFIVLSRGSNQNIRTGMGVIDPNTGVVGVVTDVSADYSVVMSLLHKDSRLNGKLSKTGETGTINWDGKRQNMLFAEGYPQGC